ERLERLLVLPRRLVEGGAPGRDVARPARALDGAKSRFRRAGKEEMASESTPVVIELRGMGVAQGRGDVGVQARALGHANALVDRLAHQIVREAKPRRVVGDGLDESSRACLVEGPEQGLAPEGPGTPLEDRWVEIAAEDRRASEH